MVYLDPDRMEKPSSKSQNLWLTWRGTFQSNAEENSQSQDTCFLMS